MEQIDRFIADWGEYEPELFKEADHLISHHKLFETSQLMAHQKQGLRRMVAHYQGGRNAYLADQMGLGKTIQCIKMFEYYFKRQTSINSRRYCLVIAPLALHQTWKNQLKKHLPGYPCESYSGSTQVLQKFLLNTKRKVSQILIISNHVATLKRHIWRIYPGIVVVDQAQSIKNAETSICSIVKRIHSKMNILVSGTPFQNNMKELLNQLGIVDPTLFPPKINITMEELRKVVNFFIIRRTKNDILSWSFTNKCERVQYLKLTKVQSEIYNSCAGRGVDNLDNYGSHAFMDLLKVCDHPYLPTLSLKESNSDLIYSSTKLRQLEKILDNHLNHGQKVIIFVHFIRTAELLEEFCYRKKYSTSVIHGKIHNKPEVIERYHSNPTDVFITTVRTGGTGLTLIQSNVVVLFNTDWNPQVDNQAIDRVHRIGQTKDVIIYRLICQGTVEERILSFQKQKLELQEQLIKTNRHSKIFIKDQQAKSQKSDGSSLSSSDSSDSEGDN